MTAPRGLLVLSVVALVAASEVSLAAEDTSWTYGIYTFAYFVPGHDDDFLQPTVMTDKSWLHLEARYNYEAIGAASVWAGYNFSVGDKVTFEVTPMFGGVFGSVTGVAPGYKATLSWTKLMFYSEGEYVFDTEDSSGSFFYAWTELSWSVTDWCRLGLVGQRTKVYETDRNIQRGVLIGFASEHVEFTTYAFNLDERQPTVVMALGVTF